MVAARTVVISGEKRGQTPQIDKSWLMAHGYLLRMGSTNPQYNGVLARTGSGAGLAHLRQSTPSGTLH